MPLKTFNPVSALRRQQTKQQRHRRGAAIVELAIALPLFTLLLLGTVETTSMIFLQQSLKIAAYESTRVALVPGSDLSNVNATADLILTGRRVSDYSVTVTPADFENRDYGTAIQVRISAPCSSNSLISPWIYADRVLTTQVVMMKET